MRLKRGTLASISSNPIATSKKGQVTIIIIVGMAVLLLFTLILYLTGIFIKEPLTESGEPVIEDVPQEFKPIQSFTQSCLEQVGKRGLKVKGKHGGYLSPELIGEFST